MLKPYAVTQEISKGRFFPIRPSEGRDDFQRDRDRIIHSKAFRRLAHKTQVFVYYEGDHYRNRLTHSLEVAQITRAIARALGVNEDLAELTALAHDLGHPPFGHAGEDALNEKMKDYDGFDHNAQALRIVTLIENRYPEHDGLNLMRESLEGILKHNGPLLEVGQSEENLPRAILAYPNYKLLDLTLYAGIEAQIAALCDDIAYNAHDIDDGLRAEMFHISMLEEIDFVGNIMAQIRKDYPDIAPYPFKHEFIRRLITHFVKDMTSMTKIILAETNPTSYDAVRYAGKPLVCLSENAQIENKLLKKFLMENMYHHYRVNRMTSKARRVIADLFDIYMNEPSILPNELSKKALNSDEYDRAVMITDFIAGMTDKFALEEHKKLFDINTDYL